MAKASLLVDTLRSKRKEGVFRTLLPARDQLQLVYWHAADARRLLAQTQTQTQADRRSGDKRSVHRCIKAIDVLSAFMRANLSYRLHTPEGFN